MTGSGTSRVRTALLEKFRVVARERIENLNTLYLRLESADGDDGAAPDLLREIHTLKGEAKLRGFPAMSDVAHEIEDLLLLARDRQFDVDPDHSQIVLEGFDLLGSLLEGELDTPAQTATAAAYAEGARSVAALYDGQGPSPRTAAAPPSAPPVTTREGGVPSAPPPGL